MVAKGGATTQTELALTAKHRRTGDHVIARLDIGDLVADRLDHSRGFVAEHDWRGHYQRAVEDVLIAVAESRRGGLDQYLVGSGTGHADLLDVEPTGDRMKDRSAHGRSFTHKTVARPFCRCRPVRWRGRHRPRWKPVAHCPKGRSMGTLSAGLRTHLYSPFRHRLRPRFRRRQPPRHRARRQAGPRRLRSIPRRHRSRP